MKYTINIKESDAQITKAISKALLSDVITYMDKVILKIKTELPAVISVAITSSPEYYSLINGQLKYDFGLVDANLKIDGLIGIWMNNIEYDYQSPKIYNKNIKSKFTAKLIRANLEDVLYSEYAQMTDTLRGYSLPWLQWLLLDGTKTIIDNYEVTLGPNKYSRTGYAIMTPSAASWSVRSEFAGTQTDNWLTRAIDSASNNINELLQKALQS